MAFLFNEISLQNHVSSFIIIHCIIVKGMITMTTILYKNSDITYIIGITQVRSALQCNYLM
jgi:hypothetical protein